MISPEDKKDVKTHLGKALAKKVSKVTDDSRMKYHIPGSTGRVHPLQKKLMENFKNPYPVGSMAHKEASVKGSYYHKAALAKQAPAKKYDDSASKAQFGKSATM